MVTSLILLDANVITLNPRKPRAQAVAVRDSKIVAVGPNKLALKFRTRDTQIVRLGGRTVVPGMIDCHIHLLKYGLSLGRLELRGVPSIEEMKRRIAEKASRSPPRDWILGRGWDQERFRELRYPNRFDLDEVAPNNPVFLWRVCGHIAVGNSLALNSASVTKETPDPVDGAIDRDALGQPVGILREQATELVTSKIPRPTLAEYVRAAKAATRKAVQAGLTTVHCILDEPEEILALQQLSRTGQLPLRFYVLFQAENLERLKQLGLQTGFGSELLKFGALKVFTDGSLGARTAALEEAYTDEPNNTGIQLYSQEELNQIARTAHEAGIQLAIHAIGDRAIGMALDAIEKAITEKPRKNHRHRIEHASVLSPGLIKQMKRLAVIASVQPHFVVSDFWAEKRVGKDRARFVYPFKTLVREGIVTVAGSDCPVEPMAPLKGLKAAIKRDGFQPEQSLSANLALAIFTREAAKASFEEESKGTIEPGKLADLVVLSRDPLKLPVQQFDRVRVVMTIVGGRVVYSRRGAAS